VIEIPIPKPKKGEVDKDFISRCMGDTTMNKEYPDNKQRSAICYGQLRKKEMIKFNYSVPIIESKVEESNKEEGFFIEGIAINATTTGNNHKFLDEELKLSANTLTGVPLLVDHRNEVDAIKGRVKEGLYSDKKVSFRAKVIDKQTQEMIKDGRVNSVSVGAMVASVEEDETDNSLIMRGITFKELSLVAVGADEGATFGIALNEALDLKKVNIIETKETHVIEKVEPKEIEIKTTEIITKEMVADIVAKAVAEALKSVKEAETKEVKVVEAVKEVKTEKIVGSAKAEDEEEVDESASYNIVESYGSIKGGSFTIERR